MTWLALSPAQMWLLAGLTAAAVTVLFFLKVRNPRITVGSLLLWRRIVEERHPDSLLERLRRLVSYALALLIGLLLASSLGRPLLGEAGESQDLTLVVDTSPSMETRTADGRTRFAHAVERARAVLRTASPSSRVQVLGTSGSQAASAQLDPQQALDALDALRPLAVEGRLPASLGGTTYLFTDGVAFDRLPDGIAVVSVFEPADNVGITAFEVRAVPARPREFEAFLEVVNYSAAAKDVALEVGNPGRPPQQRAIRLAPLESFKASFAMRDFQAGEVNARIRADGDALPLDDVAYAYLPSRERLRAVLVTPGNRFLEVVLAADERLSVASMPPAAYANDSGFDLVVFDRFVPARQPARPALFVSPPDASWLGSAEPVPARGGFAIWRSTHPLLSHVSEADLGVPATRAIDVSGGDVVAAIADQPVVVLWERPVRRIVLAFDLMASTLPSRVAFPVLMQNAVTWLAGDPAPLTRAVGTVEVPMADARIRTLGGEAVPARSRLGATVFETQTPGVFTATAGGQSRQIAVNLASRRTSNVNESRFGAGQAPGADRRVVLPARELWTTLVLLSALLLVLEWWTYHRRLTV